MNSNKIEWKTVNGDLLITVTLSKTIKINPAMSGDKFTFYIKAEELKPSYHFAMYYKLFLGWKQECKM